MTQELPILSNELALLLCACRSPSEFERFCELRREQIDWDRFTRLAQHHNLGPLACKRLADAVGKSVIALPPAMADLQAAHRAVVIRNLALETDTCKVVDLLSDARVRVLPFKGSTTGRVLHGDEHDLRYAADIDILVSPNDMERVAAILEGVGYSRVWPEFQVPPTARPMLHLLAHAITYESPDLGCHIEVHHRLTHNPHWFDADFEELFERSEEVVLGHRSVRTLGAADLARYLCCHMLDHDFFRLKWIDDARRAIERLHELQPELASSTGQNFDTIPSVDRSITVIANLFGAHERMPAPPYAGRMLDSHTRQVISELEDIKPNQTKRTLRRLLSDFRLVVDRNVLGGSLLATWHDILVCLVDVRDVRRLGLGTRWQWLYALLGLVFAVERFVLRTIRAGAGGSNR